MQSPARGAATSIYVASAPALEPERMFPTGNA